MNAEMLRNIAGGGLRGRDPVPVGRRVVQVHLEHRRPRAARRSPPALAQRPHERGALRRRRGRARGRSRSWCSTGMRTEWEDERKPGDRRVARPVREVRAVKDEQYLYLRLRLDEAESWRERPVTVGLDVRPGENSGLPDHPGRLSRSGCRRCSRPRRGRAPPGRLVGADPDPLRARPRIRRGRPLRDAAGERRLGSTAPDRQPAIHGACNRTRSGRPSSMRSAHYRSATATPSHADFDQRTLVAADGT